MKKILPILLVATVYLAPLYPVYAQSNTPPKIPSANRPLLKVATTPGNLKPVMVAAPAAAKMEMVREKTASRAAELRAKLAKFKDKVKANRVENINENLNTVNDRKTSQMQQALTKISQVLERLKAKTAEAANAGKDVTEINAAISNLEKEWAEADAAVKAQAEKDYTVVVNTESTVKADASTARDSLRVDLKVAHDQVIEARQALASAISTTLSLIKGGNSGTQ